MLSVICRSPLCFLLDFRSRRQPRRSSIVSVHGRGQTQRRVGRWLIGMSGRLSELVAGLWRRTSRRPLIFLRLITHEASARVPPYSRGPTHLPALSLAQNRGWLSRTQPCSLQAMEAKHLSLANVLQLQSQSAWNRVAEKDHLAHLVECGSSIGQASFCFLEVIVHYKCCG